MSMSHHPLRVTIAEEVRVLMARRRMSAVRLGVEIGRSQSYMSRRLTGDMPFDLDDLEAICAALDVPISSLMGSAYPGATDRWSDESLRSTAADDLLNSLPIAV